MPDAEHRSADIVRWPYAALGYLFVGLALVGVVIPGLPTFPFLLLAGWAASRGSRRLHDWLYQHPRFGPSLVRWREERSITRRAKRSAVLLIALSWLILWWRGTGPVILLLLAALFVSVSTYVLTRPEPAPLGEGSGQTGVAPDADGFPIAGGRADETGG